MHAYAHTHTHTRTHRHTHTHTPASVVVQGEAVGPAQVRVDEDLAVGAVQMGALDLGDVSPVCPEQIPGRRQREREES